jgi:hypothetical protein
MYEHLKPSIYPIALGRALLEEQEVGIQDAYLFFCTFNNFSLHRLRYNFNLSNDGVCNCLLHVFSLFLIKERDLFVLRFSPFSLWFPVRIFYFFLIRLADGGVQLGPLGTAATDWFIAACSG